MLVYCFDRNMRKYICMYSRFFLFFLTELRELRAVISVAGFDEAIFRCASANAPDNFSRSRRGAQVRCPYDCSRPRVWPTSRNNRTVPRTSWLANRKEPRSGKRMRENDPLSVFQMSSRSRSRFRYYWKLII